MSDTNFLTAVLLSASDIARSYFGKATASVKKDKTIVTEADIEIGRFLIDKVKKEHPLHNIVDEEMGVIDNKSDFTWVIDPIDGTSNFAAGVPLYGILIGLLYKNKPVAGGIALPAFSEIYTAEEGKRAFCNGISIQTTSAKELKNVLVAYGLDGSVDPPERIAKEDALLVATFAQKSRNIRSTNSIFDGMMVARGAFGVWMHRTTRIWDNVATHIILQEAGCTYTDFYGKPIDYLSWRDNPQKNFTLCGANPSLHAAAQDVVHNELKL